LNVVAHEIIAIAVAVNHTKLPIVLTKNVLRQSASACSNLPRLDPPHDNHAVFGLAPGQVTNAG